MQMSSKATQKPDLALGKKVSPAIMFVLERHSELSITDNFIQ